MRLIFHRRPDQLAAMILLIAMIAGCSSAYRPNSTGEPRHFSAWEDVPPERADVRFESADAPEIIAARRRTSGAGVGLYEVALANRTLDFGENKVIVATMSEPDPRPLAIASELTMFGFTPEAIDQNVSLLLQGARQTSPPVARRNRYGPYHFIAAEYPGSSRCVYAWQEVEGGLGPVGPRDGRAAVQFRYCDPEQAPADMIAMFDRLIVDL